MNATWVEGRVPPLDVESLERRAELSITQLLAEEDRQIRQSFRYPADCKGVGETWIQLVKRFPQKWLHFSEQSIAIDAENKTVVSKNDTCISCHSYDLLLSTIPLPELGTMSHLVPHTSLRHSTVILVGLGLLKPQPTLMQDICWIYFPCPRMVFYRCTLVSNFSSELTPDDGRFWSLQCEIGMKNTESIDEQQLMESVIQGLLAKNIVSDRRQIVDRWMKILPYGYPIPTLDRDDELRRLHGIFEQNSIYSRGRFGGWKYETANQDHCFAMGVEIIDRLLFGKRETVYCTGL